MAKTFTYEPTPGSLECWKQKDKAATRIRQALTPFLPRRGQWQSEFPKKRSSIKAKR